jgi:hypothetical protein
MITHSLSKNALERIDQYLNLRIGHVSCPVLYFNNKTTGTRAALASHVGKGTPEDISHELTTILFKQKISLDTLSVELLRKTMLEHHIGIDCSGFVYHVLDTESISSGHGRLHRHLTFKNRTNIFRTIAIFMHPEKNTSVAILADNSNSSIIPLQNIRPGDLVVMTDNTEAPERDHILIIHRVDYDESSSRRILYYSHSVAYPEDGLYGTGVRQGTIDLATPQDTLFEATWIEDSPDNIPNRTFLKARSSKTEIRRIHWK